METRQRNATDQLRTQFIQNEKSGQEVKEATRDFSRV